MTNTTNTDFQVGQLVNLTQRTMLDPINGGYGRKTGLPEQIFTISRVNTNRVIIRFTDEEDDYNSYSAWIEKGLIKLNERPLPRKLGEVPEGMISPDDPRLDWLWKDAGVLADRLSYCSQYDALTAKLNIPGRERDFTVSIERNGINLSTKVKARSQKQANEFVAKALES